MDVACTDRGGATVLDHSVPAASDRKHEARKLHPQPLNLGFRVFGVFGVFGLRVFGFSGFRGLVLVLLVFRALGLGSEEFPEILTLDPEPQAPNP